MEILSGMHGWHLLRSEAELTIRFGTSRNAMRDALDMLRREGIVERVPGAGTFVVTAQAVHRHDRIQGLSETLEDGARRVTVHVVGIEQLAAPIPVAGQLGVAAGSDVIFFERRLDLDGEPLSIWISYLPADLAGGLLDCDLTVEFHELIQRRLGLTCGSASFAVEAKLADESMAELLDVRPGAAILYRQRLLRLPSGRPLEFGFVYMRGDRISLVSEVTESRPAVPDERP
jgi:GntR family transcriptional regulator